jgi:tetratricopeptide (TPR) repeat protein
MFTSVLRSVSNIFDEVLRLYARVLHKHRALFLAVAAAYTGFLLFFVFRSELRKTWETVAGKREAEQRIKMLEAILEKQQVITATLTSRENKSSLLRNLEFKENWKTDRNRTETLRLLEYANFALEKEDYPRAKRMYEEAAQIQPTLSVPYYLGRLAYLQGDLSEAESNWRQVVNADTKKQYPEVRLYLGMTLYEMGREREAKDFFREYLGGSTL